LFTGMSHIASVELAATREQLAACEARVAHLTALLSEVESDSARVTQLNSVLKEEIRRQQRSQERTELAHNLEYLKNVVLKVSMILFISYSIKSLLWHFFLGLKTSLRKGSDIDSYEESATGSLELCTRRFHVFIPRKPIMAMFIL